MDQDRDLHNLPEPEPFQRRNVRALLRRLRRGHPLREAAESVLDGDTLGPETAAQVLARVEEGSLQRPYELVTAAWMLPHAALTPEQRGEAVTHLMAILRRKVREDTSERMMRALRRSALYIGAPLGVIGLATLLLSTTPVDIMPLTGRMVAFWLLSLPFAVPVSFACDRSDLEDTRVAAARALGRLGDVRAAGALAAALCEWDARMQTVTADALGRLLPKIGPEHCGTLERDAVPNLCRALRSVKVEVLAGSHEVALALELLGALERVGDGRAVESVERYAVSARCQRLRAESERILPVLRARRRQAEDASRLLRPANRPDVERLLRPACNAVKTDPNLLLHPLASEEQDAA